MLTLPNAIVPVLHPFATLFRSPTWRKAQILLIGAILAPGHARIGAPCIHAAPGQRTVASALRVIGAPCHRRSVSSALRVMGLSDDRNCARYHQVLNRAVWSPRQAARILLGLLILYLDQGDGSLIFGIRAFYQSRNPGTAPRS